MGYQGREPAYVPKMTLFKEAIVVGICILGLFLAIVGAAFLSVKFWNWIGIEHIKSLYERLGSAAR